MPLEPDQFNFEDLSAFHAAEKVEIAGNNLIDNALNIIKGLQSMPLPAEIQRNQSSLLKSTSFIQRMTLHFSDIFKIRTLSAVRQKYFVSGQIYNLSASLSEFKSKHYGLLTTGSFELQDCLLALQDIYSIEAILKQQGMPQFSTIIDQLIMNLNMLALEIDGFYGIFPELVGLDRLEGFTAQYAEYVADYIKEIKRVTVLASIHCIDENLKNVNCFLSVADCKSVLTIMAGIPLAMVEERKALIDLTEHIEGIPESYKTLLVKLENVIALKLEIDTLTDPEDDCVVRRASYCQGLDKAMYFNPGMCFAASQRLIRESLTIGQPRRPEPTRQRFMARVNVKYSDLHNLVVTEGIFSEQNGYEGGMLSHPTLDTIETKYGVRNFFSEDFGDTETLNEFAASLLKDVFELSEVELRKGNPGPRIIVSFKNETNIGHAVALQMYRLDSKEIIYRFIDYNAGEFILKHTNDKRHIQWLAFYLAALRYSDKYHRYQILTEQDKTPTVQDTVDFNNRAKLSRLFATLENALHLQDQRFLLKEILYTYYLIQNKQLYDHFSVWFRLDFYLTNLGGYRNRELYKDVVFFVEKAFMLLDKCNEYEVFKPMYKAHKFSVLASSLVIALRVENHILALAAVRAITGLLNQDLFMSDCSSIIEYFNALNDLSVLEKFKHQQNFRDLIDISESAKDLLYSYEKNKELFEVAEQNYCLHDEEIKLDIATLNYGQPSRSEQGQAFDYKHTFRPTRFCSEPSARFVITSYRANNEVEHTLTAVNMYKPSLRFLSTKMMTPVNVEALKALDPQQKENANTENKSALSISSVKPPAYLLRYL